MPTPSKPTKTLHTKPREKKVRLQAHPQLTRSEIKHLQARAAQDMQSTGNYVAFLLMQYLSGRDSGQRISGRCRGRRLRQLQGGHS